MDDVSQLLTDLGLQETRAHPLSGGDISEVMRYGDVVIKAYPADRDDVAASEVRSLRLLAEHDVPVPQLLGQRGAALAIRWIQPGPDDPEALGRTIARMHQHGADRYGGQAPLTLATLALPAATGADWRSLFWTERLLPLVRRADTLLGPLASRVERLVDTADLPREGPALLHGDLWSGNVLHGAGGPVLIDPSSWWGERGIDLAMMRLFGGFDARCWDAYREIHPIPREVWRCLDLYQLYPLLAHVCLFGRSYVGDVARVLDTFDT